MRKFALWSLPVLAALIAVVGVLIARDSSRTFPNRNPLGETFPAVAGRSLQEVPIELPAAFSGAPAVLLVGYEQRAQFDIDRWLMGLMQAEAEARIVELPTIPALLPSLASGWIDDGMRSGIPKEDWGVVITLYGEAARPIAELTGTERGRLARVIVLDSEGTIVWFDDQGYSPGKALTVAELVSSL